MAHGRWILFLQQGSAAAAGLRVVLHHLIHPLDWQQLRPRSGMVRLTTAFAATALTPCRRLKPGPIGGGQLGGVARAAVDLLAQAGQFDSQGGELAAELLDLLLLGQDKLFGLGWPLQPIRVWNPGRRRAHHRRSLLEMKPGIKLQSRVQQGRCSLRAVSPPERFPPFSVSKQAHFRHI